MQSALLIVREPDSEGSLHTFCSGPDRHRRCVLGIHTSSDWQADIGSPPGPIGRKCTIDAAKTSMPGRALCSPCREDAVPPPNGHWHQSLRPGPQRSFGDGQTGSGLKTAASISRWMTSPTGDRQCGPGPTRPTPCRHNPLVVSIKRPAAGPATAMG